MATKLIQAPIPPCSYVFPPKSIKTTMKLHTSLYYNNPHCRLWSRSSSSPPPLRLAAAAAAADLLTDEEDYRASSSAQIKQHLLAALQGKTHSIFILVSGLSMMMWLQASIEVYLVSHRKRNRRSKTWLSFLSLEIPILNQPSAWKRSHCVCCVWNVNGFGVIIN